MILYSIRSIQRAIPSNSKSPSRSAETKPCSRPMEHLARHQKIKNIYPGQVRTGPVFHSAICRTKGSSRRSEMATLFCHQSRSKRMNDCGDSLLNPMCSASVPEQCKVVVSLRRDEALQQAHGTPCPAPKNQKHSSRRGADRTSFSQRHMQDERLISAERDGYIDSEKINIVCTAMFSRESTTPAHKSGCRRSCRCRRKIQSQLVPRRRSYRSPS